jgi:RNA polymerase sigma factor (sigma-70 family)
VVERQPRGADSDASWSRCYAELWPRLVRAVAASVGTYSGVEDAVQEAFVVALSEDRQRIDNLGGWLYTVALRSIHRSRRRDAIAHALRLRVPHPAHELDDAIERIDLLSSLARLPQRDRELLIAKHYFGLTQDELAAGLRMRRGTVSAALSRAAAKLRAIDQETTGADDANARR